MAVRHTELVAFGVCHDGPSHVDTFYLLVIETASTHSDQTSYFCLAVVGANVEMDTILGGFGLGNPLETNGGRCAFGRADGDVIVVVGRYLGAEGIGPELSELLGVCTVDGEGVHRMDHVFEYKSGV